MVHVGFVKSENRMNRLEIGLWRIDGCELWLVHPLAVSLSLRRWFSSARTCPQTPQSHAIRQWRTTYLEFRGCRRVRQYSRGSLIRNTSYTRVPNNRITLTRHSKFTT